MSHLHQDKRAYNLAGSFAEYMGVVNAISLYMVPPARFELTTYGFEVFGVDIYTLICGDNASIVSTFWGFECPDCLLVLQVLCYLHQTAPTKRT